MERNRSIAIIIAVLFLILLGILGFRYLNTNKILEELPDLTTITDSKADPTSSLDLDTLQGFSDPELGISFSFPADWNRPRIVESEGVQNIVFPNSVTISIGENTTTNKESSVASTNISNGETITVTYGSESVSSSTIESIVETIEEYTSSTGPSITPTPTVEAGSVVTPTLTAPTPDPTLFFENSENCTYGCVDNNKFQ